jgi:hypothetical protein
MGLRCVAGDGFNLLGVDHVSLSRVSDVRSRMWPGFPRRSPPYFEPSQRVYGKKESLLSRIESKDGSFSHSRRLIGCQE